MDNNKEYIEIKDVLAPPQALICARYICSRPRVKNYCFDFSKVEHCPPFGMLAIINAIDYLKRIYQSSNFEYIIPSNSSSCDYMAYLGFFQALGWDTGRRTTYADRTSKCIPITRVSSKSLFEKYPEQCIIQETIERLAHELSLTLTQERCSETTKTLSYCIREIMRNSFEHSQSHDAFICGQYWPSRNKTEPAIMDYGCGIKQSLARNPLYTFSSDSEANKLALQPGVSSVRIGSAYDDDVWQNSGYGLYMASALSSLGGHFILASGNDATFIMKSRTKNYETKISGTLTCLAFDLDKVGNLDKTLLAISKKGEEYAKQNKGRILTASKVSSIASLMGDIST